MDLTQEPTMFKDASVTQLFYWTNFAHDRLYDLGFTEAAGNFQTDNFGKGGAGNDPVNAEAQDGSGTNNANFSTPVDGGRGRMQMFNWTNPTPDRDGSFEAEVVLHEYCHGLSNRLVGGPSLTISALSTRGMGEGWSDFFGLALTAQAGDNPHGNWARAGWSRYLTSGWLSENYFYGARRYSYSTDMLKNPHTLKDIDPTQVDWHTSVPRNPTYAATQDATQVHYQGTVWSVTLWDLRANLILKHGFASGNERAMFLVAEGMKLGPANPNFIQSRDGIIQATLVNYPADLGEVWTAFAKRGMGQGATAPASTTTTGVLESYLVPDSLEINDRSGWNITGNVGGPFTPATKTLTLSNDGGTALNWTANPNAPWLSVSPASGTLGAGANVVVTVTTQAGLMPPGFQSTNLVFANTTSSFNQPVGVRLYVTPPVAYAYNLDTNPGWTTTGEWAFGTPTGGGGSGAGGSGNADPAAGATGANVFGVNLGGNHSTSIAGPHYLTMGPVDLSARKQTRLRFQRWLNTNALANTRVTVEVSNDGTNWREVFVNPGAASTDNAWTQMEYDISTIADQQGTVYARWSYRTISSPGAYAGWNIDDVELLGESTAQFTLTAPASVSEGAAALTGTVNINQSQPGPVTVTLTSSNPAAATVTPTVTLPAGELTAPFTITPVNDINLDGTQTTSITASAPGISSGQHVLAVTDDEAGVLTFTAPASVTEGNLTNTGSVGVDATPTQDVVVTLQSANPAIVVPASVIIPSGSTGPVNFNFSAPDNAFAEGPKIVLLTASVSGWTSGQATVTVNDDDATLILLTGPASASEGDGPQSYTATVNTVQATDLVLNLSSSNTAELTVPTTVTIPTGQLSANFSATIVNDTVADGVQITTITAAAPGYPNATRDVAVADNEVDHYTLAAIASPHKRNTPFAVSLVAEDINNAIITNHAGAISLTSSSSGGPVPFTPAITSDFSNGSANTNVTVSATATAMTLTATDGGGKSVTSNAFDVVPVTHATFLWSGLPASSPLDTLFNATATAKDDAGATVAGYTDPTAVEVFMAVFDKTVGSTSSSTYTTKLHNTAAHDSRMQMIYTATELGAAKWLGGLSFSLFAAGGQTMTNYTLRLKHTDKTSFDGATWEEGGFTTVSVFASALAGSTFFFNTLQPFFYNGTQNLMVDVSFDNTSASTAGQHRYVASAQNRVLSGTSNSTHGDPLTWTGATGPTPVISNELPTVSWYLARSYGPIPASPVTFASGVWNGQAFAPISTNGTLWLRAVAPSGVSGFSNRVAITSSLPVTTGTAVVFSDGFETGVLGASWSTAGGSGGTARTQVTAANLPKTGFYHLTMDTTSTATGTFARNAPTATINLAGRKNVSLEWFAKSFAEESNTPTFIGPYGTISSTSNSDSVAMSPDGITWVEVSTNLRALLSTYGASATRVVLDPIIQRMGWDYNSTFRIRFSQYDDQAIPNDGIGLDDIAVKANPTTSIGVSLPGTINEGTLLLPVTITLPSAPVSDVIVTLTSSASARLSIVSPVTVLAGQTTATTTVSAPNDQFADIGKAVFVTATAAGYTTSYTHSRVLDNEVPVLAVSLPPSVTEGSSSVTGTVSVTPVITASSSTTIFLSSSNTAEATVSSSTTLGIGALSTTFTLSAVNDSRLDGTQNVTITASGLGLTSGTGSIDVLDNETTLLTVTPPGTLSEGGPPGVGTVSLSGTRTVPTTVNLQSDDLTEATVTASVIIPAGQTSANFQVFPVDDVIQDGAQTVTLTVAATDLTNGTASFQVLDNDPYDLEISSIPEAQLRNVPFSVTIAAKDESGATLTSFSGMATLTAAAGAGTPPVTPATPVTFTNGVWTGNVTIGAAAANVTITATTTDGAVGLSNVFNVTTGGPAVSLVFAPVASPQSAGTAIPVSLFAADAAGALVNEINDVVTVELVTSPGGMVVASAILSLVNGSAATTFTVPAPLPTVYLRASADTLSGQSANFAITAPGLLAYAQPELLFEDGFESGSFGPAWTITGTGTHRTIVTTANVPRTGSYHLVMDSNTDVSDARNEATLSVNLAGKSDVEFSFWMKESSDEDNGPPTSPFLNGDDFDGVAISADGVTWYEVQGLRTADGISSAYKQFKVNLSAAAATYGLTLNSAFKIRLNHYDNYTYGTDGFAFDDVRVTANSFVPPDPFITLFQDGFETGVFGPAWEITGTVNHRTVISSAQAPRGGYHMLMDVHSIALSRNEATLTLNLSGMNDAVLKFWAKEFSDEDHGPPTVPFTGGADFDGVAVSADGITWYEVQPLRNGAITSSYQEFTLDLDAAAATYGLSYGPGFKIRFNHYDDNPLTTDGFAFDDVSVSARPLNALNWVVPATVAEGGTVSAHLEMATARTEDTVITLSSNRPASLSLPASIIIPAGSTTSASFDITAVEDSYLTTQLAAQVLATAPGVRQAAANLTLLDNDLPTSFSIDLPSTLAEGASINGTLNLSPASLFDLSVTLAAAPTFGLTLPASVTLPAGSATAGFTLAKPENNAVLEPAATVVTATLGSTSADANVTLSDNDTAQPLVITLPATVVESAAPLVGTVGLAAPQVAGVDILVSLTSSTPGSLTVPATVTILAGQNAVSFNATPIDNALQDGERLVTLTASANGITGSTRDIMVQDDELHHLAIDAINSPQAALAPFNITVRAQTIDNQPAAISGTATLVASAGSMSPLSTGAFTGGIWTGAVTFAAAVPAVTINASTGATTGASNSFAVFAGPRLAVNPASVVLTLPQGEADPRQVMLSNPGDLPLNWSQQVLLNGAPLSDPPLATVLTSLNAGAAILAALVPNRYDFTDGISGTNISDGGGDMYDGGNYLGTNITTAGTYLNYADNSSPALPTSAAAGSTSRAKPPVSLCLPQMWPG